MRGGALVVLCTYFFAVKLYRLRESFHMLCVMLCTSYSYIFLINVSSLLMNVKYTKNDIKWIG